MVDTERKSELASQAASKTVKASRADDTFQTQVSAVGFSLKNQTKTPNGKMLPRDTILLIKPAP